MFFRKFFSFNHFTLILFLSLSVLFSIVALKPSWQIAGDGFGYYSYLRSAWFDHDLNFKNEYQTYDQAFHTQLAAKLTSTGRVANPFAAGLSILWLPFFIVARLSEFVWPHPGGFPGLGINYRAILGAGSIIYTLTGLVLLFDALKKIVSARSAWLAVTAIFFLSPLPHYVIYEPFMAHGPTFAGACLLFWYSIKIYFQKSAVENSQLAVLGLIFGLTVMLRWQSAIFVLLPAAILTEKHRQGQLSLKTVWVFGLSALICFLPQMIIWKILYGSPITIPQGTGFVSLLNPHIVNFLFSSFHGLFFWHPLLLLGIIGLLFSYKKSKLVFWCLLAILISQVWLNASVIDWWGSWSFGGRRMIESLFVFALGFAFIFEFISGKKILSTAIFALLAAGVFFNGGLMLAAARSVIPLDRPVPIQRFYSLPWQSWSHILQ